MKRNRARKLVLSAVLPLWLGAAVSVAAPVPVSVGPPIDSYPSVVHRRAGGYLIAFTRTTVRNNQVTERDVLVTGSPDGVTWSPPVSALAGRGVLEGPGEIAELPDGTLLLLATVPVAGVDRIQLASSVDGMNWNPAASPIELGWGASANQRSPHAAIQPDGSILLVYEVPDTGGIYISLSTNGGLLWDQARSLVASGGRLPKILRTDVGLLLVAYEGVAPSTAAWATRSPGGPNWADWPNPPVTCFHDGVENRTPVLTQYWDGSLVGYGSVLPEGGTGGRDVWRRFSANGSQWTVPAEIVAEGPLDQGNPHPVIAEPGRVCVAWDETAESAGVPVSGDIFFECTTDTRCTVPPVFPGSPDASDADPCALSGTLLSWQPAASWGSGASGTYTIYRSEAPIFQPDRANLLAEGITETFFLDSSVTPGTAYCYIVRAVNDEVCGAGGTGLSEGNTIHACAKDSMVPLPDGPIRDLRLGWDGRIQFGWTPASGSAATELRRATVPGPVGDWTVVDGAIVGRSFVWSDPGEGVLFYTIRGVNSCGVPGP